MITTCLFAWFCLPTWRIPPEKDRIKGESLVVQQDSGPASDRIVARILHRTGLVVMLNDRISNPASDMIFSWNPFSLWEYPSLLSEATPSPFMLQVLQHSTLFMGVLRVVLGQNPILMGFQGYGLWLHGLSILHSQVDVGVSDVEFWIIFSFHFTCEVLFFLKYFVVGYLVH